MPGRRFTARYLGALVPAWRAGRRHAAGRHVAGRVRTLRERTVQYTTDAAWWATSATLFRVQLAHRGSSLCLAPGVRIAGVFLQRFTVRLDDKSVLGFRDGVAGNVRAASEAHGRVFAIMYDISGHSRETVVEAVERDWVHLVDTLRITDSPQYLRHHGRPVLAIWGLGFRDRAPTPEQAAELIDFFKNNPEPRYRVTLLGGIPARWRTLSRDSQTEEAWTEVYRSFDILSPWTVGRFRDDESIDRFYREEVAPDLMETNRLGLEYMPVVFPGFSWHNMNPSAPFNPIPRRGGRFFWHQIERALEAGTHDGLRRDVRRGRRRHRHVQACADARQCPGRRATRHARRRRRSVAERLVPAAGASGTATVVSHSPIKPFASESVPRSPCADWGAWRTSARVIIARPSQA